jgi:transketolase
VIQAGQDVTIFGTGQLLSRAIQAAETLAQEGISVEVVNIGTLKPLNRESVIKLANKTKAVVTVEEHTVYGGLGSAIAEALLKTKIPIVPIGINDRFGQSAKSYEELLVEYGLTKEAIYGAVKEVLTLK